MPVTYLKSGKLDYTRQLAEGANNRIFDLFFCPARTERHVRASPRPKGRIKVRKKELVA